MIRYDVALLKLNRPVVYRDNILPICLPQQGRDYESTLGVVAGWGKTDTSFGLLYANSQAFLANNSYLSTYYTLNQLWAK